MSRAFLLVAAVAVSVGAAGGAAATRTWWPDPACQVIAHAIQEQQRQDAKQRADFDAALKQLPQ